MALTISASDVTAGYTTSLSTAEIDALITFVDQADACLTNNSVSDAIGQRLKILAVQHMLSLTEGNGGGRAISERSASGAARTFSDRKGRGLDATTYGALLRQLDQYGCVTAILSNGGGMYLRAVGPAL